MKLSLKKLLAGIGSVVCAAVIALFAMLPIPSSAAYAANPWMKDLPDNASVKTLSIPGTHDSGATHSIFDVAGKCQDLSIAEQLNIGVRFFDIRLQLVNDKHTIVHSFVDQNLALTSVLQDFSNFLTEYPTEFLIVSIKKEEDAKNSTKGFEEALLEELAPFSAVTDYASALPSTVQEARGKIFFLSRYSSPSIGVPAGSGWRDSTTFTLGELYVQDNYCIDDIAEKQADIQSAFDYSKTDTDKLVLNFTSCYLDNAFPPSYAGTAAAAINPWLTTQLQNSTGSLGVVIGDFMTANLAKLIYGRNFQ